MSKLLVIQYSVLYIINDNIIYYIYIYNICGICISHTVMTLLSNLHSNVFKTNGYIKTIPSSPTVDYRVWVTCHLSQRVVHLFGYLPSKSACNPPFLATCHLRQRVIHLFGYLPSKSACNPPFLGYLPSKSACNPPFLATCHLSQRVIHLFLATCHLRQRVIHLFGYLPSK